MGGCTSKPSTKKPNPYATQKNNQLSSNPQPPPPPPQTPDHRPEFEQQSDVKQSPAPFFTFLTPSPALFLSTKKGKSPPASHESRSKSNWTPGRLTPGRFLKKLPFPPPSPAKHIKAFFFRRHEGTNTSAVIHEGVEGDLTPDLDKNFGFSKQYYSKYEAGEELGRGHFGYTCSAIAKKGDLKGQKVAVKVIPKAKMTTAVAIEDVRREVRLLRALKGHKNIIQFYDAFEDEDNVYIVMELCQGGELLDRILERGGKYTEDEAKEILVQILDVVAYCHLQGVVHRDLKPENFLFASKDENSQLKLIDFGLSDFARPDEKLNDIVGSAYYVAPEVLHRSYATEADAWSIGVIAYILLCGSRPFWAQTESGIFRSVLKADPDFSVEPWPALSSDAKDFVKRLLFKDPRKRMSAAQALCHPWIRYFPGTRTPLDILIFRLMKDYMRSSTLRKAALRALSKTLAGDELFYFEEQFKLLKPNEDGCITLDNLNMALMKNSTDAFKESHIPDFLSALNALQYRRMDFGEFCAATLSVHQLEALDSWQQHARPGYEFFDKAGNRAIVIVELASELELAPSVSVHDVLRGWLRQSDGKLSFQGFIKVLHGPSNRTYSKVP